MVIFGLLYIKECVKVYDFLKFYYIIENVVFVRKFDLGKYILIESFKGKKIVV